MQNQEDVIKYLHFLQRFVSLILQPELPQGRLVSSIRMLWSELCMPVCASISS